MIERHAVTDTAAAVVPDDGELHMTELLHHFDQRVRHRALGVGRVACIGLRRFAPAIAGKVGQNELELLRKRGRDAMILDMRLREAVDEKQRRTFAAGTRK